MLRKNTVRRWLGISDDVWERMAHAGIRPELTIEGCKRWLRDVLPTLSDTGTRYSNLRRWQARPPTIEHLVELARVQWLRPFRAAPRSQPRTTKKSAPSQSPSAS